MTVKGGLTRCLSLLFPISRAASILWSRASKIAWLVVGGECGLTIVEEGFLPVVEEVDGDAVLFTEIRDGGMFEEVLLEDGDLLLGGNVTSLSDQESSFARVFPQTFAKANSSFDRGNSTENITNIERSSLFVSGEGIFLAHLWSFSMLNTIRCTFCHVKLYVGNRKARSSIRCPKCKEKQTIPIKSTAAIASTPAPGLNPTAGLKGTTCPDMQPSAVGSPRLHMKYLLAEAVCSLALCTGTCVVAQSLSKNDKETRLDTWPEHQRFDYVVRTRPVTNSEMLFIQKTVRERKKDPHREAILFTLRELTGKDLGKTAEDWSILLPLGEGLK